VLDLQTVLGSTRAFLWFRLDCTIVRHPLLVLPKRDNEVGGDLSSIDDGGDNEVGGDLSITSDDEDSISTTGDIGDSTTSAEELGSHKEQNTITIVRKYNSVSIV
jgi:hypothetical protein